jgi:hypothetical protein
MQMAYQIAEIVGGGLRVKNLNIVIDPKLGPAKFTGIQLLGEPKT